MPQIQRLLETVEVEGLCRRHPRAAVVDALRATLADARLQLRRDAGPPPDLDELVTRAADTLAAEARPVLRRVINATGVVLHTNLGRAPLPAAALAAMAEAGAGYCNLELDMADGRRGVRGGGVEPSLCAITGAQAALAVNNAAGALLLALSALAAGGEVIVSRGELIEIGGGFRIPEVIAQGGARLVEVGTTNKTRIDDYRRAITERTRVLLKVHQSNYRIVGFTAEATLDELAALAGEHGLVVMHDLGGGALIDLAALGRSAEPTPQASLAAGADLVAFSGDKLMGGPQAGLLIGGHAAVDPLRRHPLVRALRPDKTTLAGLEATLRLYRDPARAVAEIPTLRMLAQTAAEVAERCVRLHAALAPGLDAEIAPCTAQVGGGSLPGEALPSWSLAIAAAQGDPGALAARLRAGDPAVVGRIGDGRLILDLFTVADEEVALVARRLNAAALP